MTNWNDLDQVKAYANRLGTGMVVVKHASRDNYNITHANRHDLWMVPGCTVLHRT